LVPRKCRQQYVQTQTELPANASKNTELPANASKNTELPANAFSKRPFLWCSVISLNHQNIQVGRASLVSG
jgi:hypothetical protein